VSSAGGGVGDLNTQGVVTSGGNGGSGVVIISISN
jgi:hypothetical protein